MPVFRQPEHAKDVVRCCRNHTEEYSGNYALHPLVRKMQMSGKCQLGHIRFVSVILGIDQCKGQPFKRCIPLDYKREIKFFHFFQIASSCLPTLQDTNLSFLRVRTAHFQCISEDCHGLLLENREFKIYDATVAKTSPKIASSRLSVFFVIISVCLINFSKS